MVDDEISSALAYGCMDYQTVRCIWTNPSQLLTHLECLALSFCHCHTWNQIRSFTDNFIRQSLNVRTIVRGQDEYMTSYTHSIDEKLKL